MAMGGRRGIFFFKKINLGRQIISDGPNMGEVVTTTKYSNQYNHSKILITFQITLHYNHQNINYIPNTIIRRILLYFEKATHFHTRSEGPEV